MPRERGGGAGTLATVNYTGTQSLFVASKTLGTFKKLWLVGSKLVLSNLSNQFHYSLSGCFYPLRFLGIKRFHDIRTKANIISLVLIIYT